MRPEATLNLSVREILDLIPEREADWVKQNHAFYDGDHWQRGTGWVGPRLPTDDPSYAMVMAEIQMAFSPKNVIREVVDRFVNTVLSDDPVWSVVKTAAPESEPAKDERLTRLLGEWWAKRQCLTDSEDRLLDPQSAIAEALRNALLARRGTLRVFVPPAFVSQDAQTGASMIIPSGSLEDALAKVFLHVTNPVKSTVTVDDDTVQPVGVYTVNDKDDDQATIAEISYVDGPETVLLVRRSGQDEDEETRLGLHGQLMHYEMVLQPPIITESIRRMQKQLNLALTMMGRNTVVGGFLERVFLNAQLPGKEVINEITGEAEFQEEAFATGPGTTAFVSGIRYVDAAGETHIASPSVVYRNPVDPATFIKAQDALYAAMLSEVHQAHALTNSESDMSGWSRQQARVDFEATLKLIQGEAEAALAWAAETILRVIGMIAGDAYLSNGPWRVQASLFPTSALLTTEEIDEVVKLVEGRLISRKTAMQRVGVRAPEEEQQQIDRERSEDSANETTTLASALVAARDRTGSGRASTGLEQTVKK